MIYINNILLNFQREYYEFYEWNSSDKIKQYKNLPIIKTTSKDLQNIKNNTILLDKKELDKKNYIFSDGNNIVAVKLDKNGFNKYKSSINIIDQERIINKIKNQKKIKINYKIIKKNNNSFNTRKELENKAKIINELNKSYQKKEYEKLKYIYFECFNKKEKNINLIIKKIKKEIINNSNNFNKIIDIINLTKQNN